MARCDFAEQHILPDQAGQPTMRATQVIMHSMAIPGATPLDLIARWSQPGTPLESHFIVGRDGRAYQLIDTSRSADANYHANLRPDGTGAISIETEDNIGHPDTLPWTPQQVATLVRLALWAEQVHGVPRRQCRSPADPGQGFHTLFGAPSDWTPVAKTCPGAIRIRQWHEQVLPAIQAGQVPEEDTVSAADVITALKDPEAVKALRKALWGGVGEEIPSILGTTNAAQVVESAANNIRDVEGIVRELAGRELVVRLDLANASPDQVQALGKAIADQLEIKGHPTMNGTGTWQVTLNAAPAQ
jgi:hypothetical protein